MGPPKFPLPALSAELLTGVEDQSLTGGKTIVDGGEASVGKKLALAKLVVIFYFEAAVGVVAAKCN